MPTGTPNGDDAVERSLDRAFALSVQAAMQLVGRLPPRVARELCAAIARLYAVAHGPRIADARANLELAFPELPERERRRILGESFANLGRSFAEVARMLAVPADAGFERVRIEGREHLEALAGSSDGAGALVLTAHFGSWEFCAAALAQHGLPVSVVQHPFANRALDRMANAWRETNGLETLPMGRAALGIFRALARGRYVALLLDQNAGEDEGVFAPFFGIQACTRSGPAQLAMSRDTPVVPVFFYREGTSGRHVARIGAPLELEPEGDAPERALATNVARMNAVIEAAIREAPSQWIWIHRRFKTRPPGAVRVYAPRRGVLRSVRRALRAAH